ncbi:MAG: DUF5698 domain-containing protein [Bacilli bacterium]
MDLVIYIFIFFSKVIENSLGTFRLIIVSNGKKMFAAILQFLITLIWLLSTSIVMIDINKDPFKIVIFCIGTFIGSYLGSFVEEKIAIGSNMLICVVDDVNDIVSTSLRKSGYVVTVLKGEGFKNSKNVLLIMSTRKKRHEISNFIKNLDKNAIIISESATMLFGNLNR